ncbi:MAG: PD-(D/E)XK nuclease family protein [Acidobacteria bacterium]|nr:PD-(D/E)XK nuclease family protein [Acidobacteriota bacterium]
MARQRAFVFGQTMARVRGRLWLSYATQNLADGSRLFPSPLMLQAFRLGGVGKQLTAGYEELEAALGTPTTFVPEQTPLGSDEWWLAKIADKGVLNDAQEAVLDAFPDLRSGRSAMQQREEDESGEFDGRLKRDAAFDPRRSRRVLSATSLENYAKCPRSYFFSHVLGISSPEDLTFEPGRWLDALQGGSLLHDFYCRFLVELKEKKEKRDPVKHQKRAAQVLDEVIAEWKAHIPPPSESVFDAERSALHRSIMVFLEEEKHVPARGRGTPEYFEISFGFEDSGMTDPVEINLPGGKSIFLRGRIDRIDRLAKPNTWAVWDYKTGRADSFARGQYTAGGTQLQHILYGCAAEQVLAGMGERRSAVAVSGYLFSTERADGNFYAMRDTSRRAEGLRVVNELLDAMAAGVFLGTGGNCGYCDWKACCHPDEEQRWKLLAESNDKAANLIQKVQENE